MTPLQLLFQSLRTSMAPTLGASDDHQRTLLDWLQLHTADVADIRLTLENLPYLLGMALNNMFRGATEHLRNDLGRNSILDEVLADPQVSLWANCGDASDFYLTVLQAFGIRGNLVSAWHTETDGHTLVQFFDAVRGVPVLYDPFYATVFLDAQGQPLSLSEVMASDRSADASSSGIATARIGLEPAVSSVFQYYQSLDYQTLILGPYFRHVALRLEGSESVANYDTVWRAYPTAAGLHSGAWLLQQAAGIDDDERARFDLFLRNNFSLDGPGRYLLTSSDSAQSANRAPLPMVDPGLAIGLGQDGTTSLHNMARDGALLAQFDTSASAVAGRTGPAGVSSIAIDDGHGLRSWYRVVDGEVTLQGNSQSLGTLRGWVDVDGDGTTDLLSTDTQTAYVMTPQGVLSRSLQWTGNTQLLATGDFTGDGRTDMLVATSADALAIVSRSGSGWTAQPVLARLAAGFTPIGVADFNGDGTDDLLLSDERQGLHVWVMHQGQLVGAAQVGVLPAGHHVTGIVEHSGDAVPDLLLTDDSGQQQLLVSRGDHYELAALPLLPDAAGTTLLRWGELGRVETVDWPVPEDAMNEAEAIAPAIEFMSTSYIAGQAAIEERYAGSTLVARTRFDIDGSFQWSQIADRFDTTGQLVATSTLRDNGARDEKTYGENGPGSWRTDYLNADAQLTFSIAAAADGSRSHTYLDVAGNQTWSQYTDSYDAEGVLRQRQLERDAGTSETTVYAGSDRNAWTLSTFDAAGRLTTWTLAAADGSRVRENYDADDASTWARIRESIDAAGRVQSRLVIADDGSTQLTTGLGADLADTRLQQFDADGRELRSELAHADGRREVTTFDALARSSWHSSIDQLSADGVLERREVIRDSGAREVQEFDATSPTTWVRRYFDADGALTLREDVQAGSVKTRTFYDHADSFAWSSYDDHYDVGGALVSRSVMRDSGACELTAFDPGNRSVQSTDYLRADGTQWYQARTNEDGSTDLTTYDADELAEWASYTNHVVAGFLQSQDLVRDDGRREITTFDADRPGTQTTDYIDSEGLLALREVLLDGGEIDLSYFDRKDEQTWAWYRDHFDTNAQRTSREVMRDDGAREITEYDTQNQHPWTSSTSYYDSLGNLLTKVFESPPIGSS